jgi:hypothetical protein
LKKQAAFCRGRSWVGFRLCHSRAV